MMKPLVAVLGLVSLVGCAARINTQGIDTPLAAQCKIMTYRFDQTMSHPSLDPEFGRNEGPLGALAKTISGISEADRRQDVFNACVAAGASYPRSP
jgi:hypothetical protein